MTVTAARLSISDLQTKMSLALRGGQLEMTDSGGGYILKPIPHGEFQHLDAVPINEHLAINHLIRHLLSLYVYDPLRLRATERFAIFPPFFAKSTMTDSLIEQHFSGRLQVGGIKLVHGPEQ